MIGSSQSSVSILTGLIMTGKEKGLSTAQLNQIGQSCMGLDMLAPNRRVARRGAKVVIWGAPPVTGGAEEKKELKKGSKMNRKESPTTASCARSRPNECPAARAEACACKEPCGKPGCCCGRSAAAHSRPQKGGDFSPKHAEEEKTPRPGAKEAVQSLDSETARERWRNPELPFMADWEPTAFADAYNADLKHRLSVAAAESCHNASGSKQDGIAVDDRNPELPFMADWEPKSRLEGTS